jgi:bacterioferritin (cytochrome b1)
MAQTQPLDPSDPRLVRLLSYYRDAELRGATLLLHMLAHENDPAASANLTHHLADESRHQALITQRITALGATPQLLNDGYQKRMARAAGVPKTMLELYAITVVAEERARGRYVAHLKSGLADAETAELLRALIKDEVWHLSWVQERLAELDTREGGGRAEAALRRYREADAAVAADLAVLEREAFGVALQ